MKPSKLGIIILIGIVVGIGLIFLLTRNSASTNQVQTILSPTKTPDVSPLPSLSPIPTTIPVPASATPAQYPAAVKEKVRSEFINLCNTKAHYSIPVCTCTADYLAKNYSESKLAEMYIQYHASSQIPKEIETAVNTCSAK